jgi:hypothetical protein
MVTSVSSAGPATGAATRPDPQELFKRLDTQGKGYLAPEDIASAIVTISPQGSNLSREAVQARTQAALARLDGDKDGKVTQTEFTQAAAKRPGGGPDPTEGLAAGAERPAGEARQAGKPAAPAGQNAATAGAGPIYSPADANRDGTVTVPERYAYETQQAPRAPKPVAPAGASSPAAERALQAYRNVDQLAAA